jgi:hypothetical protein
MRCLRTPRSQILMNTTHHNTAIEVGKYLVSPLPKELADGRFAAAVSIRSGRGSNTHDRVMRFPSSFATRDAAVRYATEQGLAWVHRPLSPSYS